MPQTRRGHRSGHTRDTHRDSVVPTKILGACLQLLQVHHLLADHAAIVMVCRDTMGTPGGQGVSQNARHSLLQGRASRQSAAPVSPIKSILAWGSLGVPHLSQGAPVTAGG